ncbi:A-kinase anchor protein 17B-like [Leucoraja erinacea]|uniref:A-kinase anchor protein 17B-like n=1 Tax=Leucoraja erinaceus TaxID=7782 RepID=UPI002456CD31|nr:A-kinase anchor protein 17B-like [Leucoraja erinacea]
MAVTRLFDTSDAVELFAPQCLFLKPIARLAISVMLPGSTASPKLISNWELMETLKKMAHPEQITSLKVSRHTMEFIRFEAEVENKNLVRTVWERFNNKMIRVNGINAMGRVLAAVSQVNFPSPADWETFFNRAKSMNEAVPGERADTIHMEGLPCKWFSPKHLNKDKPVEEILLRVFGRFGGIRNIDIPMLDPYREEMTGKKFATFSAGGLPTFEAYVQYQERAGFERVMERLRGMKLVHRGEDGKALACNIKVTFDTTKHLSDAAIEKRHLERLKLQELERQRGEQKRRDQVEEQSKEAERKRKDEERERRRKEKLRRREHRQKECEERRYLRKVWRIKVESEKEKREASAWEERKLVLAQRRLDSIRLITILLKSAKETKVQRSHLPERDMVKCIQKRVWCEDAGVGELKKEDGDTTRRKCPQRVKSGAWRQVKGADENFVGKVHRAKSSQYTSFPHTSSLPPAGLKQERCLSSLKPAKVDISTPCEPELLQITVKQNCSTHPRHLGARSYDNCLCNGFSRKVTSVDHLSRHRLHECEEFLASLHNYHQLVYPLDSNHANLLHGATNPGDGPGWCRSVSDSGKGLRVDLRNESSPLCSKSSGARRNTWADYDGGCNYTWTIAASESGEPRRDFSSRGKHQVRGCDRKFQVKWKDSGCRVDLEEDFASGYRLLLKDTGGGAISGCTFKNQDGRLTRHLENPRVEIKDLRISSKESWRNPITNWKISIQNSQDDVVRPRLQESDQCRNASNCNSSWLNSQYKAPLGCTSQETVNARSGSNRKIKRTHKGKVHEYSADADWSHCKPGIYQDVSKRKSNKKSETYNDVKPSPAGCGSDLKYSWKGNKREIKEESDSSIKPCRGHQRKDLWNGEDMGEIPRKELFLADQLCDAFSLEVKHKKQRKNSRTKVIPKANSNKHTQNRLDSNRIQQQAHWKHMWDECVDNHSSSERACFPWGLLAS